MRHPSSTLEELTTNFELDNSDSYSVLVQPDGETIEQEFASFPKQRTDVSFGVSNGEVGSPLFFPGPTPGVANGMAAAPSPRIETDSGAYFDQLEVKIESHDAEFQIRYTVDGSTPTIESNLYAEPFMLNAGAMLQAVAFDVSVDSTLEPSIPASANFFVMNSLLADDSSDLPLVVVNVKAGGDRFIEGQASLDLTRSIVAVCDSTVPLRGL